MNPDKQTLHSIRTDYSRAELAEASVASDPLVQFGRWIDEAIGAQVAEPTAMVLSTVDDVGRPASRVVLLKGIVDDGLRFYTNYASRKGQHLLANPNASLLFFWPELERQVRIEGVTRRLSEEESFEYFSSRPLESRIGAWASAQSTVTTRDDLERTYRELSERFADGNVPLPPTWGGYSLHPDRLEFWQGRPSRMHDRIQYRLDHDAWIIERLSP